MRIVLRASIVSILLGAACTGPASVGLQISLPSELVDETAWFEIGAFKDASCASVGPMLGNGVPDGWTRRIAFRRDDDFAPRFGEIPNGRYAFGVVARSETCAVLATGCKQVDFGKTDTARIGLFTEEAPIGACENGASCEAARCVPANDNADPSVGAGCSLELLGAGPLVSSEPGSGTLLSAPAIAATSTGFLIAYREVDPDGASARLILLPIDHGGGALPVEKPRLPSRCADPNEVDGVGLVVSGEGAMITLARPPCDDKPALELLNLRTTSDADPGRPTVGAFRVSTSPTLDPVTLGAARSAAGRPNGGLLVFTQAGAGHVATISADKGVTEPSGTFGGFGITGAWVAATDRVLALLAAGTGEIPLEGALDPDAGEQPMSPEGPTLRLVMAPGDATADVFDAEASAPHAPIVFPGEWGSVAAVGGRVIVLSDGTGPGRSATYRTFDRGRVEIVDEGGFSVESAGKVTAGDVTVVGDRAYFAVLKQGAVGLHVYDNATTTPTPLAQRSLGREPRVSGVETVRDGRVSVAATSRRVAVAWTTARALTPNDAAGGYAVFACTD